MPPPLERCTQYSLLQFINAQQGDLELPRVDLACIVTTFSAFHHFGGTWRTTPWANSSSKLLRKKSAI